jgi:hypothetical protein
MDELARRIADVAEAVHEANKRTLDPVIIKLRDAFRYSDRVSGFAILSNDAEPEGIWRER